MIVRFLALSACLLVSTWTIRAAELAFAATSEDLDLPHCQAFVNGKEQGAASREALEAKLGLRPVVPKMAVWDTGAGIGRDRAFRIAFTKALPLGAICTPDYTGGVATPTLSLPTTGTCISYLKPTAEFPGDVTKDDQWLTLPSGVLKTLPPGVKTRALRLTVRNRGEENLPTVMGFLLLFTERYYSALNIGGVKRTLVKKKPEGWVGTWRELLPVSGLVLLDCNTSAEASLLKAKTTEHPLIAPTTAWQSLPLIHYAPAPLIARFDAPMLTRAIRLTGGVLEWRMQINTVLPLVNLGDNPNIPTLVPPPPPFAIHYTMPMDGFVALDIHDRKTGQRIRRMVAEVERGKGPNQESWDLKDDAGTLVPPGEYEWRAVARPPFKLTYEMSVYNAGQPAWWAPPPGKGGGGWLADHTPPYCVAAMGDTVWLGAQCTESGHVAVVTDLDGNKLWGRQALSWGFSGPDSIAVDGRYGYLLNDALIMRVDPKDNYKEKTIWEYKHTDELPGNGMYAQPGHCGAAAKGDKLYVAFNAPPESWLRPSFRAETIDSTKCLPLIRLQKGNGHRSSRDPIYLESEYDELMRLYAAFLTDHTPTQTSTMPDTFIPSSTQAFFGDAPDTGPLTGSLTVTFTKPIDVGSILLSDGGAAVYALKPGAKMTDAEPDAAEADPLGRGGGDDGHPAADAFSEDTWIPLTRQGKAGRPGLALAPEGGLKTEALRFKAKRVTFSLVMAHRLEDIAPLADRVLGEGAVTPLGGWQVARELNQSISSLHPATMALVWKTPVTLRGVSFYNPSIATLAVDYWTGPATGDPSAALNDASQWKEAGVLHQEIFTGQYFPQKATLRSCDFGELVTTRAVRLRALSQELIDGKNIAGFQAVMAYRSLGGDATTLPRIFPERITEFQLPGADGEGMKILREIPFPKPSNLAFGPEGALYAISKGQVVTVPLTEGERSRVVLPREAVGEPFAITLDADGLLYVTDNTTKTIKVFNSKTGEAVRSLLKAGGQHVGPWDQERVDAPTGVAIDSAGKLWLMDNTYQPKRVMRMTRTGQIEKVFLGPTRYGGGGWLDEKDKTTLIYNGMKFKLDWTTRTSTLDAIMFRPGDPHSIAASNPERIIYYKGKRYVVGEASGDGKGTNGVSVICREEHGIATPMAAAGLLASWGDVETNPELRNAFGNINRDKMSFVWSDLNGDGKVQANEVQVTADVRFGPYGLFTRVGEDLAFIFVEPYRWGLRIKPVEIRPDGVPVYDLKTVEKLPRFDQQNWETEDGRCLVIWDRLLAPDGKTPLWEYEDKYAVFAGYYISGWGYDRPAGKLNAEQTVFGHFSLPDAQGKMEEYFVTNSDQGDWFVFTGDGVLLGCIFGGPTGYGKRQWTMPEWEPGKVDLTDLRLGQEHYQGCVVRADDGKVYAVAGHNHVSLVRVDGLEQLQRLSGAFTVTAQDQASTRDWEVQKAAIERLQAEPKIARLVYTQGINTDGALDDWPDELFFNVHEYIKQNLGVWTPIVHSQAALACDENNLYIAARVTDTSPLKNSATDPKLLFKGGDALDVWLGLDTKADPARKAPAPGDVRILIAMLKGQPVAEIFRYNVPGADPVRGQRYKSPVAETYIDVVETLDDANVELKKTEDGWTAEVAIPWKALGVPPFQVGDMIRGDVGVLESDENGMRTIERLYWSGKSQIVVCDTPSEARISPILWGDFKVMSADTTMKFGPEDVMP